MTPEEQQILLKHLLTALQCGVVTVELVNCLPGQPYPRPANEYMPKPTVTARVREYEGTDGVWLYWWTWHQPISSVSDLGCLLDRFCDIVLAVEGKT
jgi:hypothetical protein